MSKTYRPWNPDQDWLLPPSPREWLPEGDLVYFMLDADSGYWSVAANSSGRGTANRAAAGKERFLCARKIGCDDPLLQ